MQSRFVTTAFVALSLLAAGTLAAQAQPDDADRYGGGQTRSRWTLFGGNSYANGWSMAGLGCVNQRGPSGVM